MTDQEKRDLVNRYLDAYNAFDVDGMVETLHPDVVLKNVSDGTADTTAAGIDEFRAMAEKAADLFATRTQTVTAYDVEDEGGLTIEVVYAGELAQDLPGDVEAGETVRIEGRSTFRFEDGQIAEIIDYS